MTILDALYIAALARELRDDDTLHVGASQEDVWMAAKLAAHLWAPRIHVVAAGSYLFASESFPDVVPRTYERDFISARSATFRQSFVFDDLKRSRVVFAGGMQVDARGNANLVGIYDGDRLVVRGPGSGGLPTLTSYADRFYLVLASHTPRVLVPLVSRVSVLGDPVTRLAMGLPADSLHAVITPLGRFEPTDAGLRLTEIAPGWSAADLARQTGFPIVTAEDLRVRQPLTADESGFLKSLFATNDRSWD